MNWYLKFLCSAAEIHPFDYETWDEYQESIGMDGIETEQVATDAEKAFSESKINLSRDKEISRVVILDGKTIGAIATGWDVNNSDKMAEFSFDMAIQPNYRGNVGLLLKMINEGIKTYRNEGAGYNEAGYDVYMRLWVVNKKLVNVLQRYGFEVDEDHGDGTAHMIYRGQ